MAIDYIIQHKCPVKRELSEEAIVHLVKSQSRAEAILKRFMDQGMKREEAMNAKFGISTLKPSGDSAVEMVTVGSLFKQAELLDDHRDTCKDCPVGAEQAFGCYGSINYPISEVAEEWVSEMAEKASAVGMPNSVLLKFILDENVTGETMAKMRQMPDQRYFEAEFPIEIEVENEGDLPLLVDTNQLLEMFFAVGEMGDVHQQFLLLFSGGLTIQGTPPDMRKQSLEYQLGVMSANDGTPRYWVFRMPYDLKDDRSIRQIKEFLRALFLAQCSQAKVSIDY